ncbi:MAG: hypothetical protein KAI66_25510, partial [Lentisphaeria bacterium]|nr:hypothetical protein [Lentisphaeria bacterium]
ELEAWAEALGYPLREVIMLNCSYEMSHVGGGVLGCTAGVRWVPGLGMVHLRNMDWPLKNIGAATRVFEFHHGERVFYAVGISGFVGVLSGMLPGGYSVTINWAPPVDRPRFDFGPAFLLRAVFEECDTYEEAVQVLRDTPLASPVFFTVCGVKKGQACVIERTRGDAVVRKFKAPVLAQGNHHVARKFRSHNWDEELVEDSQGRVACMEEELGRRSRGSLDELAACLDVEPVLNEESYQQMAFCPRTGEMKVWRWVR